jgi:hypothetical protein
MIKRQTAIFVLIVTAFAAKAEPCIQYLDCADGRQDCEVQAHETCPSGYRELNEADLGPGFQQFIRANFNAQAGKSPHMVVSCN